MVTFARCMICFHMCSGAIVSPPPLKKNKIKNETTSALEDGSILVNINSATISTLFLEQKTFPRLHFVFLVQSVKLFIASPRRYDTISQIQ